MARQITRWFLGSVIVLALGAGVGTQAPADHKHQMPGKPSADMSASCKAMMADHEKMAADVKAADERLDGLVARMTAASGQAKADATAAVVTEMVAQRKTIRDGMMKMHAGMMSHMMEHMQAGSTSMAMCPMMKMGGMKH